MKAILAAGVLGACLACSNGTDLQTGPSQSVSGDTVRIELAVGSAVNVDGISILFESVTGDSRCPLNVQCVWEGNAEISLRLTRTQSSDLVSVNTNLEPRVIRYAGQEIRVADLTPYPVYGEPLDPSTYIVALMLIPDR